MTTTERDIYLQKRKQLYQKNKERICQQNKERYFRKRNEYLAARKKWKDENAEKVKEYSRLYNLRTKEIRSLKSKSKRGENTEELNRSQREKRANRTPEQRQMDLEYARKYRIKNKERITNYHKSISERRRSTRKAYFRKKYRTDVEYKLLHNMRSRIKNVIKGVAKDSTTISLLGCTLLEFKIHIEGKFTGGMCWGRILDGSIHIDHIVPCSFFDLRKPGELEKCFHYTNLQPLWAVDNLKKGRKCSMN